jgi:hypothetical protein
MEYGQLIDFIAEEYIEKSSCLDLLEFYYPHQIYMHGNHLKVNNESRYSIIRESIKDRMREFYCLKSALFNSKVKNKDGVRILSGAYFGLNKQLEDLGFDTYYGPWLVNGAQKYIGDLSYIHDFYKFKRIIKSFSFQDSISPKCDNIVRGFVDRTRQVMKENDVKAFIASSTHTFANRIPLKAAKEERIPTFVFLHGLPFHFYYEEPERADFLIVWSNKIKENFLKLSKFPEDRIFVSGHPLYKNMHYKNLRNSLDNILIVSPSSEIERNLDRGNMIYYLLTIEKVLKKNGVSHVRFRPHPHENTNWYLKFINKEFFIPDTRPLKKTLEDSTLVIGTLSTIVVEALYYGVNYILYDPLDDNGRNVYNHVSAPPFDGTDSYLAVANSMEELADLLRNRACTDIKFFDEYIKTPFDISFMKNLVVR